MIFYFFFKSAVSTVRKKYDNRKWKKYYAEEIRNFSTDRCEWREITDWAEAINNKTLKIMSLCEITFLGAVWCVCHKRSFDKFTRKISKVLIALIWVLSENTHKFFCDSYSYWIFLQSPMIRVPNRRLVSFSVLKIVFLNKVKME